MKNDIEHIKNAVSITEIVSRYVELSPGGSGKLKGLCPFHGEKTPSFIVNTSGKDEGTFHCFGCSEHGDIFDFIQKVEGLDQGAAIRFIQDRFMGGAPADAFIPSGGSDPRASIRKPARIEQSEPKPVDTAAVQFWTDYADRMHEAIKRPEGKAGLDYFTGRGISQEMIDRFRLGYDPKLRRAIVPGDNGYCIRRDITDQQQARYMNPKIPENAKPGEHGLHPDLFNSAALYQTERPVFIVEGALNALSILQAGGQAVATNSTGNVKALQRRIEQARPAAELIIWFDDDESGQKAARAASEILKAHGIKHTVYGGKAK